LLKIAIFPATHWFMALTPLGVQLLPRKAKAKDHSSLREPITELADGCVMLMQVAECNMVMVGSVSLSAKGNMVMTSLGQVLEWSLSRGPHPKGEVTAGATMTMARSFGCSHAGDDQRLVETNTPKKSGLWMMMVLSHPSN